MLLITICCPKNLKQNSLKSVFSDENDIYTILLKLEIEKRSVGVCNILFLISKADKS